MNDVGNYLDDDCDSNDCYDNFYDHSEDNYCDDCDGIYYDDCDDIFAISRLVCWISLW